MLDIRPTAILDERGHSAFVGGLGIHITRVPRWDSALATRFVRETLALSGKAAITGSITHFLDAMPGAAERKAIKDAMVESGLGHAQPNALISDSAIMRAGATAYSWLTGGHGRAFALDELDEALAWMASEGASFDTTRAKRYYEECLQRTQKGGALGSSAG